MMICYHRAEICINYSTITTEGYYTSAYISLLLLFSKMPESPPRLRSLYRSILRELPHRPLSTPSPIQQRIRSSFSTRSPDCDATSRIEEGEQFIQYARAQRMYATLLERYNPGMSMDEEERVRLTARRVGMDLPVSFLTGKKS